MEKLNYGATYAKAALEGKRITWSSVPGVPLVVVLSSYRDFAGQPVFVGDNIRASKVGAFDFSALTTGGLTRDFEEMMKTNRIVFVRDRTNAVWVMDATNELAFRQKFGLAR